MAKTKAELVRAVLEQMRQVGVGETIPAPQSAFVEKRYDSKLAQWRREGFVWWTNTDRTTSEIPDEVFATLCDLIENEISKPVGEDNPVMQKRAIERQLLRELRRMNPKPPSGESTPFSAY